jgi:hypothetical protein
MRVDRLLANRFIPEAKSLESAQFDALIDNAKRDSRDKIGRFGWIFVGALVLPFLAIIVPSVFWLSAHAIPLAWTVIVVPLDIAASIALSEAGTFWVLYPALSRSLSSRKQAAA